MHLGWGTGDCQSSLLSQLTLPLLQFSLFQGRQWTSPTKTVSASVVRHCFWVTGRPQSGAAQDKVPGNSLGAGESPNPRNASSEAQQTNLGADFSKKKVT